MSIHSMQSLLRSVFGLHPKRLALQGRSIEWTYAELDALSATLAQALLDRGVVPGSVVPVLMGRSPLLVLSQLALVRIGACYSPIDLSSPAPRQRAMLDAIGSALLLTDGAVQAPTGDASAPFDVASWVAANLARATVPAPDLWLAPPDASPVYVMFTSGSTGVPKGVMVPHAGIVRLVHQANYAHFGPEQRWGFVSSPAFDLSTLEVWGALLNGGCCVVQEAALPSLDELGEFLLGQRITDTWLTSALFNAMVEDQLPALGGFQQLLVGGERVSAQHARLMLQAHPQVRLINGYGPTENTTFTLCHTIGLADTEGAAGVPIGTPLSGTQVRVDPSDPHTPDRGELWAAGHGVALGYLGDAELTQRKFVWHDQVRWYRTGDLVRERPDGVFEFHGRIDRQIKLRGLRIELEEVELALTRCPGVGNGAVLVVGDSADRRRIVAAYSLLDADGPAEAELAEQMRRVLPEAAVPAEFFRLPQLPANLNGKVDRHALVRLFEESRAAAVGSATSAPADLHTDFETGLAAIWRELLPHAKVARDAHFLHVGGTSLLALHVATRVRKQMQRELPPIDVLRHPLLADQAQLISQLPHAASQSAVYDASASRLVPLSHIQTFMLAGSEVDLTRSSYLVHVPLVLPQLPDWPLWRAAFEQLALRHPSLRLRASHDGTTARGSLEPALPSGWWRQHDPIDTAPGDLDWPDALLSVINRPLDADTQGSMRVDGWPLRAGGALVVWTLHHHVVDEASIANGLAELDALLRGQRLAPVYGSPFAFKSIESAWADRPEAMSRWAARLAQTLSDGEPPLERAPALGHERRFSLAPLLQARLQSHCANVGCTPFALLLTAYGLAIQEVFGARFRFVSTPFSRRAEPELIEPFGYLLDVRFIEAGALPHEPSDATLARVHGAILEAQRPAFQWLDVLMDSVSHISPKAAQCLTQFGFTWRLDPARPVPMAGQTAQLLRVPQVGARFSMFLHATRIGDALGYSIEAVESAHRDGQVALVAQAFERRIAALCAAPSQREPVVAAGAGASLLLSSPIDPADAALADAWARWLKVPKASIHPASHFLRSGGSSLTAMRMAAELRRDHGVRLDVGAFLADASFAQLAALSRAAAAPRPDGYVLVGPVDFSRVMLLVPGSGGHVAALYALADELRQRLPQGSAVAIVDLDAALHSAPHDDPLWFVSRRIVQVVRDLGQPRVLGVVGFSMGGALALKVAEQLGAEPALPIWMLDTFAPRVMHLGFWRKVERRLAWALFGGRPSVNGAAPQSANTAQHEAPSLSATTAQWDRLGDQLAATALPVPGAPVRLIQARVSVKLIGLLWQRRNNGFVPRHYASWRVYEIDGEHLDLPRHLASATAGVIVEHGDFDAAAAPRLQPG